MPHVKSLTDVTIRTTIGHTIQVPADTPTYIPPEVVKFARQQGLAECDEEGNITMNEEQLAKNVKKPPRDFTTLGSPPSRYGPTVQAEDSKRNDAVQVEAGLPPDPGMKLDNTYNNLNSPNTTSPQNPAPSPSPNTLGEEIPQLTGDERENPKRREEVVRMAVEQIYRDGNPDDFTVADHRPKVKAVEQRVGFGVSGTELQAAVDRHQADQEKKDNKRG